MRAIRNSEEQNIIKKIRNFADRCSLRGGELLEPIPEDVHGFGSDPQNELSPEFVNTMSKLIPTVLSMDSSRMTMRELSSEAGLNIQDFYQLITANIYKSPRTLARKLMLSKAANLLENTDKSIREISEVCGFVSPNYFIAMFYHQMKITPEKYRYKHIQKRM